VAIVGVLATIAIPQYYHILLRSKRSELSMNLDAIRTIEIGYQAEWSAFTSCSLLPTSVPGRKAVPFPATTTSNVDWSLLGWRPDGRVYGQYEVRADNTTHISLFRGEAFADIDGDGNLSNFRVDQTFKPQMMTANTIY
jgi:type II secretory pathway pseudopilin PulG